MHRIGENLILMSFDTMLTYLLFDNTPLFHHPTFRKNSLNVGIRKWLLKAFISPPFLCRFYRQPAFTMPGKSKILQPAFRDPGKPVYNQLSAAYQPVRNPIISFIL